MSNLFSKPKTPKIEAPQAQPVPDDALQQATERQRAAARVQQQGRASTIRTDNTKKTTVGA